MASLIHSALPNPRRPIVFIEPTLSVKACVSLMTLQNIGALVVQKEDKSLLGMVTERDIVRECVHLGLDPNRATAADIAYKDVSILDVNDPVEMAMETITKTKRRHLLVNENGELAAILSIGDVLFYILEDKSRVIEHLEKYIQS
jgi:CBS domain-containing protein